ncbi:hypothetical protein DESUT3_37690 [Desulfuromonas versatilis]|uniref:Uncharacterized protein n=1 Tax=Desulfuromonas versatilis TaxID=2802975 RepID=A0ABM8I213_9BACT|nr:SdrD B-like domain-containing protein [Desulfuromonas versatilis]BCR06700.1 hypothetical protein DESUT3_37690 [Desulfuromonas versatilis]
MNRENRSWNSHAPRWGAWLLVLLLVLMFQGRAQAFIVNVVDPQGTPIPNGFRWLLEEDTTTWTYPGTVQVSPSQPIGGAYAPVPGPSIGLDIHKSYAPVVNKGNASGAAANVNTDLHGNALDTGKRYFLSVLPYDGYANSGAPVAPGQTTVTVVVNPLPLPTAQITILAHVDHDPINNIWDETEAGLGGCTVKLADFSGGAFMWDAFGNPLGTTYQRNGDGSYVLVDGAPQVLAMGSGVITTLTYADWYAAQGLAPDGVTPITPDPSRNPYNLKPGEAVVKNLTPGKYGVVLTPPGADDSGNAMTWVQTATIEGTTTIDAWVKANEPNLFVEGFGQGVQHVIFGFVKTAPMSGSVYKGQTIHGMPWQDPSHPEAIDRSGFTGKITGTLRLNHFSRPPTTQGFFPGKPVAEGWVGLNDTAAVPEVTVAGMYAAPCDPETGYFEINNVPPGTYTLSSWDAPLLNLFATNTVTVPAGAGGTGETVTLGDVLIYHWFGDLSGKVFMDANQNGFPDPNEPGIPDRGVNIRFRDGTVYQATVTDNTGEYGFAGVFPFFKWLVTEVDFASLKATGLTTVTDFGGPVLPDQGWVFPSRGKLNPQPQCLPGTGAVANGSGTIEANCSPDINPNTGNNLSRTETGPVLTQAMHLFLNQFNEANWGKANYAVGENGGISGIVFYANTRAENDPRYAVGEPWEPGIPRVQVNLYQDNLNNATGQPGPDGQIDDIDGTAGIQLADVDNFPFGDFPGDGDVDHNGNGIFDLGDAVAVTTTDSWDDSPPTDCVQTLPVIHGITAPECADAFATWNQQRPGVFNGGYAFGSPAGEPNLPTGMYIVEAATPPGYVLVKEEDKNVDFGDSYVPSPLLLPPVCVGDAHTVPQYMSFVTDEAGDLLPGITPSTDLEAPFFGGPARPLCDRKQVYLTDGKNAAADFFFFTEVPKASRAVGFALNDLTAEFNVNSPNFGEKAGAPWIPISFNDWSGREITRVYTDEFGVYNAMLPGTYTANAPAPAGFAPNMMTLVLNDPQLPDGSVDPFYNPTYSISPWTFNYMPATSSYLDTPLVPLGAFSAGGGAVDTYQVDSGPVIASVSGPEPQGGPLLCTARSNGSDIFINSRGSAVTIVNPDYDPAATPPTPLFITRDFSFGPDTGNGVVTLDGVPLAIVSWTPDTIVASVPAGVDSGRLMVTRGDNAITTQVGVTLNIVDCGATTVLQVPSGSFPTIQSAVDAASAGDLILVGPGTYNENVIMNKPVHLQGAGAGSTFINANPATAEALQLWHNRLVALGGADFEAYLLKFAFHAGEAPGIIVFGEKTFPDGNVQVPGGGPDKVLNPGNPFNTPGQALIDGFTISGSLVGGGIYVVTGADYLTISNNEITNNQGNIAGGIAIGIDDVGFAQQNNNIVIRNNKIHKNGGLQGPGGIALNEDANNYLVEGNLITGNFTSFHGGAIAHQGLSDGGVIRNNRILFNENHHNALLNQAGDGGGIYVGTDVAGATGSGSVTIDANLIQGNLTGSGRGGGIIANGVNNQDVTDNPSDPSQWYELRITNNMIVNNVAANGGGGIFLKDVARASVVNNTIANNDSTSTSVLAFAPGQTNSTPLPAGVVSGAHSAALQAAFGAGFEQTFSNPVLANNIVWHNRSWYNNAALNGGAGGLAENPTGLYQDLGVINTLAPQALNPQNCILTSTAGYDASNLAANPGLVLEYTNTLSTATVLDEGGNSISVTYPELFASLGDYHIFPGGAGVDMGLDTTLVTDFDGDNWPQGGANDIGADEFVFVPLALVSPNGGEILGPNQSYLIRWMTPFGTYTYALEYSVNNGTSWSPIVSGLTGSSYSWTVPNVITSTALVRVSAFESGNPTPVLQDVSNGVFSITTLRVDSPNGGEILTGGITTNISWTDPAGAASYLLRYSLNGGATWNPIASVTGTSFAWTVPSADSANCLVRVTAYGAGGAWLANDVSDGPFTILPGTPPSALAVVSPNGGETLTGGTTHTIQWAAHTGATNYLVRYSTNGGASWNPVASVTGTSFVWTVPAADSANCLVRVTAYGAGGAWLANDVSNGPFTILPGTPPSVLAVVSPNGGETLAGGTIHNIQWAAHAGAASYLVRYSTNGGANWSPIVSTAGTSFDWTVPSASSANCLVRVTAYNSGGAWLANDVSNGPFTINP